MWNTRTVIFAMVAFVSIGLSAADRLSSPIPPQPDKNSKDFKNYLINILPTLPASVTNDDPLTPYTEKIPLPKDFISEWFFVHIRFPVYRPGRNDAWGNWLDDLEVMIEVMIPGRNKKGENTYVILHGSQKLNSVYANDEIHNVRFFIPPYIIFRHMQTPAEAGRNTAKVDLKKLAKELPVLVTISWRGKPISYILREDKKSSSSEARSLMFNLFEKLRDSRSNYFENVILPAEYTPWAQRDLQRFESMKIENQRGR